MTVKALIVPADVTEVDSPDPVSHGAVAVNVPTAADAPARTLPTVQTGARGAEFLAAHDTPAATVNVTGGWPVTTAGRLTVIFVLAWALVSVSVSVSVSV